MSMIEILSDENNSFLSRREIICDFRALGGKLKKLEAVEMITKELKLDGKIVIPIKLQNHTGQPKITGIFYVYDDEKELIQGLILVAAALVHYQKYENVVCLSVLGRALKKLWTDL